MAVTIVLAVAKSISSLSHVGRYEVTRWSRAVVNIVGSLFLSLSRVRSVLIMKADSSGGGSKSEASARALDVAL